MSAFVATTLCVVAIFFIGLAFIAMTVGVARYTVIMKKWVIAPVMIFQLGAIDGGVYVILVILSNVAALIILFSIPAQKVSDIWLLFLVVEGTLVSLCDLYIGGRYGCSKAYSGEGVYVNGVRVLTPEETIRGGRRGLYFQGWILFALVLIYFLYDYESAFSSKQMLWWDNEYILLGGLLLLSGTFFSVYYRQIGLWVDNILSRRIGFDRDTDCNIKLSRHIGKVYVLVGLGFICVKVLGVVWSVQF